MHFVVGHIIVVHVSNDGKTPVVSPGDSGGIIVDENNAAIGMMVASNCICGHFGLATPIPQLLNALQVKMM